jgi:RNA polymerase sigma-70 factor, ECF subfamily
MASAITERALGTLASAFWHAAPHAVLPNDAEQVLAAFVTRARRQWPDLAVSDIGFVTHAAAHLASDSEDSPGELSVFRDSRDLEALLNTLRAPELYLAFACASGSARAIGEFERTFLQPAVGYVARINSTAPFLDEICQQIRAKLLVPNGRRPARIGDYAGRGSLAAWVSVVAMRIARDVCRERDRFVTLHTGQERSPPGSRKRSGHLLDRAPAADPELLLLEQMYSARFNDAFARALEGLSDKERTLLRLRLVDGVSLTRLGKIYHVHASTLARRFGDIRERILVTVREALGLSPRELDSAMALVRSKLDLHLTTQLRRTAHGVAHTQPQLRRRKGTRRDSG